MATVCYARRKDPTNRGLYYLQYIYIFSYNILLINYSLRDPNYIRPRIFYFCNSHSRPHFATHIRDHVSRLTFMTHVCDSHLRLPLATHVRDSTRDSRSRHQLRLALFVATPVVRLPTDGQTVLTPQRHLPSVPTLTLIKNILEPSPWLGLYL